MTVEELIEELQRLCNLKAHIEVRVVRRSKKLHDDDEWEGTIDRIDRADVPNTFVIVGYE
jgi:hypothetical protein